MNPTENKTHPAFKENCQNILPKKCVTISLWCWSLVLSAYLLLKNIWYNITPLQLVDNHYVVLKLSWPILENIKDSPKTFGLWFGLCELREYQQLPSDHLTGTWWDLDLLDQSISAFPPLSISSFPQNLLHKLDFRQEQHSTNLFSWALKVVLSYLTHEFQITEAVRILSLPIFKPPP